MTSAFLLPLCLLQMFEAEEDGAITEMELAVILKTALGVNHLSVSRLFTAIDAEDTGKITFGKQKKKICPPCLTYILSRPLFVLSSASSV